jgi:nucleotide-binding universal stress UspA family protein
VKQLSRVLVAVDFSKPARRAFEYALALSQQHGAALVAVHAVPSTHAFGQEAQARIALTAKLRHEAAQAGVEFRDKVQGGDPVEIILSHARSPRPDVIVMGTHQRTGFARLRRRSVAERVAANATVPVLLVPRRHGGTWPFRHVAVAVDFSAASHRAIEQAMALATADRVTLLHVVPGFSAGMPPHYYRFGIADYQSGLVSAARQRLQQAVLEQHTTASVDARILVGDTTTEISRVVHSIDADLLIVGVSRRGVTSRAVFGTTGARLLRAIRVPMLATPGVQMASADQESASVQLAA